MRFSAIAAILVFLFAFGYAQMLTTTAQTTASIQNYSCDDIKMLEEKYKKAIDEYNAMLQRCSEETIAADIDCEDRLISMKREIAVLENELIALRKKCAEEKKVREQVAKEVATETEVKPVPITPEVNCEKLPRIERDYERTKKTYLGLKKLCEIKAEQKEQSYEECMEEIKGKLEEYRKTLNELSELINKMKRVCEPQKVVTATVESRCEDLSEELKLIAERMEKAKIAGDKELYEELKRKYDVVRNELIKYCQKKEAKKEEEIEDEIIKCIRRVLAVNEQMSYEEAKKKCLMPYEEVKPVISICEKIRREIAALEEKLQVASEEDKAGIEKEIEILKEKFKHCIRRAPAKKIDPCREAKELRIKYERLKEYYEELLEKCSELSEDEEIEKCEAELKNIREKLAIIKKDVTRKEELCKREREKEIEKPDFCKKAEELEQAIQALKEKILETEKKVKTGEMPEDTLAEYNAELNALEERYKEAKEFCKRGEIPKEVIAEPCRWLRELKLLYEKLVKEYANNPNEEIAQKIKDVKERIEFFKEKCEQTPKTNISEITAYIEEKKEELAEKAVAEGTNLEDELKKLEEEKRKLVEEFTKKLKELEIKIYEVKKRIRFMKGSMEIDGVETEAKPTKLEIKKGEEKEEVEVRPQKDIIIIKHKGKEVRGDVELEYKQGVLYSTKSNKPLKVLPGEIRERGIVKKFELIDDGKLPKYRAEEERDGRFLGIIPIKIEVKREIDATTGRTLKEEKPWWSFLVAEANPQPSPKPEKPISESNPQPSPKPVAEANPQPSPKPEKPVAEANPQPSP